MAKTKQAPDVVAIAKCAAALDECTSDMRDVVLAFLCSREGGRYVQDFAGRDVPVDEPETAT